MGPVHYHDGLDSTVVPQSMTRTFDVAESGVEDALKGAVPGDDFPGSGSCVHRALKKGSWQATRQTIGFATNGNYCKTEARTLDVGFLQFCHLGGVGRHPSR